MPSSHRVAALQHTETPNHIVGLDVVQVELKKDTPQGVVEEKFQVLTAVDYATDFAQQVVLPDRPCSVSEAFHALWCRPYGPPRVVYVDPDQRWLSSDFQNFLNQNSIALLSCATESRWQLGRVEIAQRILRNMAQRTWRTSQRPPKEVIETCASVRNEHLRRHGFSSASGSLGVSHAFPGLSLMLLNRQIWQSRTLFCLSKTLHRKCIADNRQPMPSSKPMLMRPGSVQSEAAAGQFVVRVL